MEYEHTVTGAFNETIAVLGDGRKININTQYNACMPLGDHAEDCDQINKMGGRCTCGLLDGIDTDALIADAKKHGKFGKAPIEKAARPAVEMPKSHVCPKCKTYCYGDCEAN